MLFDEKRLLAIWNRNAKVKNQNGELCIPPEISCPARVLL